MHTTLGGRNFAVATHESRSIQHLNRTYTRRQDHNTDKVCIHQHSSDKIARANNRPDGLRKETRSDREEAPEEMEQTSVRYVQVRALGMEEAKGYRQSSSKTV